MKKRNMNNLLINGKRLALLVILAASVGACGRTDKSVKSENIKQDSVVQNTSDKQCQSDEQQQQNKKLLLWFAPIMLIGAAAGVGFTSDAKTKHR